MTAVRHLIVEGSSSSVDNGGAGTKSYHTLYLPHAIQETDQQCFATDGALLSDMLDRQSSVIEALKDGPNILFIQAGQNDLLLTDPSVWLTAFSAYLTKFQEATRSSGKLVRIGICTHNPRNDINFNAHRAIADQLCGFSQARENVILLSIGRLIRLGVLILLLQIRPYILTVRIYRRLDRAIWRPNIFVPY